MNSKGRPGVIVVTFIGNNIFVANYVTGMSVTLIGKGTKGEVSQKIKEFTSSSSKTYDFEFCKEWDEY